MKKKTIAIFAILTAVIVAAGWILLSVPRNFGGDAAKTASLETQSQPSAGEETETRTVRIIATSDLHGKFYPRDYALNEESTSGSMAQLATAVAKYRTENTILADAGDTIQDNAAEIFIGSEDVHPMVLAMNALNYDVWVTGNHEYDFGIDTIKKTIADLNCKTLTGNVYDRDGNPIADGYTILEKNGVRIALIGMVTPNIARWDASNLKGCAVTDPLQETRRIIDSIKGKYDVLIGVFHMGINNEYGLANSGVTDILNNCPEFDVMVSSHEHTLIPSMEINGVLVVQNKYQAQTMSVIDLTLEKDSGKAKPDDPDTEGGGWKLTAKTAESITIADYEADPAMMELLSKYDAQAREDAEEVIGRLEGGPLVPEGTEEGTAESRTAESGSSESGTAENGNPENESEPIPAVLTTDTALIDLINSAQLHYTGASVSASALSGAGTNLYPGDIRKCDVAQIYKFSNTLYKVHMNGAQLKKYMEWTTGCFKTPEPGDTALSINEDFPTYNYYMFAGVNYEVNLSREPGSRIENLTWPDGTPVRDEDEFELAVNNYCANSQLLVPGVIYEDGEQLPVLTEMDVHGEIGGIRELILDYIRNVKGGVIRPECDQNWKIVLQG